MAIIKLYGNDDDKKKGSEERDENELNVEEMAHFEYESDQFSSYEQRSVFVRTYHRLSSFVLVRAFLCIVLCLTFLYLLVSGVRFFLALILNVFSLFQIVELRRILQERWTGILGVMALNMGLFLSLFSPNLGITFLTAYCMMHLEESFSTQILSFIKSRIREFQDL